MSPGAEPPVARADRLTAPEAAGMDRWLLDVESTIPGLGGVYIDSLGRVAVNLRTLQYSATARHVLTPVFREYAEARGLAEPQFVFHSTPRSFSQTFAWKARILQSSDRAALTFVDVNEVSSQIDLGAADAAAASARSATLQQAGVAPEAFHIVVKPMPPAPPQLITDQFYPFPGGVQVHSPDAPCTLGFTAFRNGQKVFVTASHCTDWPQYGGSVGAPYWQPSTLYSSVGTVAADPYPTSVGCSIRPTCRWSDSEVISAGGVEIGALVRTLYSDSVQGSLTVYGPNPRIPIQGTLIPVVGWPLSHMGIASGWISGHVTATCVDWPIDINFELRCQGVATGWVRHGDSGGPVFDGATAGSTKLAGILTQFGYSYDENTLMAADYVFSPMSGIQSDVGTLTVTF